MRLTGRQWLVPVSIFIIILAVAPGANAEVAAGRAALFNNHGNPSYADILTANLEFESAAQSPSDQEANFFYALTRLAAFALENRENGVLDTLGELAQAVGLPLVGLDTGIDEGPPFAEPPEMYDYYDPPLSLPGGETLRAFLAGPLVAELTGALGNLALAQENFSIYLLAAETGNVTDIEVDYGDVLVLRAALHTMEGALQLFVAYNQDFDLRGVVAAENAGVLQLQRDLLDRYPDLLKLRGDGAVSLAGARGSLLNGIAAFRAAFDFITAEQDNQEDDLFFFGSMDERDEAEMMLGHLETAGASLTANTAATFISEREEISADFNRLFGNTGKPPLNIRGVLPRFDQDGEILGGTFPEPVLNSIFPGVVSERDLLSDMDLDVLYNIPELAVTLDGNGGEWAGIDPVISDEEDPEGPAGGDIKNGYVARDGDNLYWMMNLYHSSPTDGVLYNMDFSTAWFNEWAAPSYDSQVSLVNGNPVYSLHSHYQWTSQTISDDPGDVGVNTVVEARVPLDLFNGITKLQARTWTELYGNRDYGGSAVLRLPTGAISGTVSCPPAWQADKGNVYVLARSGPDPRYSAVLGSDVLAECGGYEISGLPLGAPLYLFARWDADGNGVLTFDDYVGRYGNGSQVAAGASGVDFAVDTPVDDRFVMSKPGLFRVFGSNSVNPYMYWPHDFSGNDFWLDFSDWTFLGEGDWTLALDTDRFYKYILILWHSNTSFNFDAFEDLTAGTAFAANPDGSWAGFDYWSYTNLTNFDAAAPWWGDASYLQGHADQRYAAGGDWYGYTIFPMPDDEAGSATGRQVKIFLVSNSMGDLDNDNRTDLADAVKGLQLLSGQSPEVVVVPGITDVDGNAKIGPAEIHYILQKLSGLRIGP